MADDEDIPKKSGGNTPVDENGPALVRFSQCFQNPDLLNLVLNYIL